MIGLVVCNGYSPSDTVSPVKKKKNLQCRSDGTESGADQLLVREPAGQQEQFHRRTSMPASVELRADGQTVRRASLTVGPTQAVVAVA